ncbi:MAG: fumarylacetoacetate hydrolase family protein [Gammaproteobacteria bacterium]|nr:fumarylacetoacetate hydrolase family protein [Gammaproteobacteria bacterium]MDD9958992.1 fumarylacetoacetate hydrolase family protein [Gammaproteobacteria bacterium]
MPYVFPPPETVAVPVKDSGDSFAVNRIYCVGQNYSDHVKEMGGDPKKNPPVFFSKPANAIVVDNVPVKYATATTNLHYEVELVVALGSGGTNIEASEALQCVYGYAVGIDFTRRDLQAEAKESGRPWDTAKGFDQSAPVSAISPFENEKHHGDGRITLSLNGEIKQDSTLNQMIWSVAEIIAELSRFYELKAGDLIFTGTPAGVSSVSSGDRIKAAITGVGEIEFDILD